MTGFVLMHALFYNYVSSPKFLSKGKKFSTAVESILHLVCMFVGIVVCGGTVIIFWILIASRAQSTPNYGQEAKVGQLRDVEGNDESDLLDYCVVSEGSRPRFEEVFDEVAGKHEGEEVGVLVCRFGRSRKVWLQHVALGTLRASCERRSTFTPSVLIFDTP